MEVQCRGPRKKKHPYGHKEGLKRALRRIFDHFGWSQYKNKSVSEILLPLASPPRRESTPSNIDRKKGKNYMYTGQNMLYISWMVILGDHNITKKKVRTVDFELYRLKNYISRLCTNPLGYPPHPPPIPKWGEKPLNTA